MKPSDPAPPSDPADLDRDDRVDVLVGEIHGETRRRRLHRGIVELGSSSSCDIPLEVAGVSRRHARLTWREDHWQIDDLGSKNGTRVSGARVRRPTAIEYDKPFKVGPVELRLERAPAAEFEIGLALGSPAASTDSVTGSAEELPLEPTHLTHQTVTGTAPAGLAGAVVKLVEDLAAADYSLLETVQDTFQAEGTAFLEYPAEGSSQALSILGASGAPGPLPDLEGDAPQSFRLEEGRCWGWLPYADGGGLALVVWGGSAVSNAAMPIAAELLTRTALSWLAHLDSEARLEPRQPAYEPELAWPEGIVVGRSPGMQKLYRQIRSLVLGDLPVLITGETGVGKEHVARLLHDSGDRRGKLVAINCAAIPAELLESELFGIAKGVATGVRPRKGKFVEARGGTLFLDEIGDLPAPLQAKMLRVLQDGVVEPLGGEPVQLDVRIVSATHSPLAERIEQGSFRQDLYYRLAGFELTVPPLRERAEEIPALVRHFAELACGQTGKYVRGFSVEAFQALLTFSWPGNIRQLQNEIQRAILSCPDQELVTSSHLSDVLRHSSESSFDPTFSGTELEPQLEALERRLILDALEATAGNQTRAAERLRISRNGLINRLKKLQIPPDVYRRT